MTKFKNKYRSQSHRKPNWDYSTDALYFLTIVTQNRVCNLGKITENFQMYLSDFGKIVENEWLKSFEIRNELFLHEYIIMPNHIHTIVEINQTNMAHDDNSLIVDSHGRANLQLPNDQISNDIKRNIPIRMPK